MNSYIAAEVGFIMDHSPRARRRLCKGLARYVVKNRRGEIISIRYTAKSKGRTGAVVRFHCMEVARKRGQS